MTGNCLAEGLALGKHTIVFIFIIIIYLFLLALLSSLQTSALRQELNVLLTLNGLILSICDASGKWGLFLEERGEERRVGRQT